MKNLMIRVLASLFLALSCAGLASASETRHNDFRESAKQQSGCASADEQQKSRKSHERSAQEQEFDRVLMGIYG